MPASARRGSYAKGIAKREEILTRALDVIAREGYRGASVKAIAEAVGLSQAGLLHYFGSKEELFTAVLRKRDENDQRYFGTGRDGADTGATNAAGVDAADVDSVDVDAADADAADLDAAGAGSGGTDELRQGYRRVIEHNSEIPGMVELFSRLSVDAADPEHPAHAYFRDRNNRLRDLFVDAARRAQREGRMRADIDPATAGRMLQAVADGLQLQWLLEPQVDMADIVDRFFDLLITEPEHGGDSGAAS